MVQQVNHYGKMEYAFSDTLRIRSGVRQGGVLSPHLFNLYADMFINTVVSKKTGCHVNRCCIACLMYADDLMLLSGSVCISIWTATTA